MCRLAILRYLHTIKIEKNTLVLNAYSVCRLLSYFLITLAYMNEFSIIAPTDTATAAQYAL